MDDWDHKWAELDRKIYKKLLSGEIKLGVCPKILLNAFLKRSIQLEEYEASAFFQNELNKIKDNNESNIT